MNIALVITQKLDQNAGGVQRSTSKLSQIFKSYNNAVIIISIGNHKSEKVTYQNTPVYYVNKNNADELQYIYKSNPIDIIINQMGYAVGLTKLILKHKRPETKLVNTLRINPLNFQENYKEFISTFFNNKKLGFFNNGISRKLILYYHILKQRIELNFIIKNTDAFVMLSENFKSELYSLAPGLKKYDNKIYGISNPFERPDIDVTKLEKENIILFVGRLNILQKRVDLLMEIWTKLHAECPDWQFWIVGEGESKGFMENYCKENKLERVKFFGKDNPNEYYKKAKLFHMTSAFEGFGNVLVEAQSYGCVPVLFNSYSAAEDIVTHNVDGILVKPLDVEEFVRQNLELINNPEHLKQMSIHAFENMTKFSYKETYKKWDAVFKNIIK